MMLILSTVPEFQVPAIYLIMKAKSPITWLMAKYLKDPNTNYQNNGQLPQVPKRPITEHPITQIMISYVEGECRNENGKRSPQWRKCCLDWFSNHCFDLCQTMGHQKIVIISHLFVCFLGGGGKRKTKHQHQTPERQKLASFQRTQKMPSILLRYLLFCSWLICLNLDKRKLPCIKSSIKALYNCDNSWYRGKIAYVWA